MALRARCARPGELPTGGEEPERHPLYTRRKFLYLGTQSACKSWLGINMSVLLYSLGSIAGCVRPEPEGYARTIEELPAGPPLAYWRLGESGGQQMNDRKGGHHGSYVNAVQFGASGLPQDSDGSVDFAGTGYAEIPDDPGLHLSAFSLSLWFRLPAMPGESEDWAIISKEQPGLNIGDFGVYLFGNEELIVQFQDASTTYRLSTFPPISSNGSYHLCVRADNTGFDAYLNGEYLDKNTSFTGAWTSNTQPIRIGFAPQLTEQADAIVDEVALYDRVLSEAEVIALSQHSQAPVAANDSFVVPENQTTVLNVVNNDTFVGQKANLTVEIVVQATHGMATVRGDNDIEFEADAVEADESDSFTYRITDPNGTSNTATVDLTIQDSASEGGGTLVYEFVPQASWIDGVPLSNRDANDVVGTGGNPPTTNRWTTSIAAGGGVTVGSSLVRRTQITGAGGTNGAGQHTVCWNRAPDGSPSLEMFAPTGTHNSCNFSIELYEPLAGGTNPRHMRVVMEVRTCKSTDSTTHKANGLGPTGGSYPDFSVGHTGGSVGSAIKYFCSLYQGVEPGGPINVNWWGDSTMDIHRVGHMTQTGGSSKTIAAYIANFDRPGAGGGSNTQSFPSIVRITDNDVEGHWVRHEIEVFLGDPGLVPDNARRSAVQIEPSHTGNGFVRVYATPDVDGDLGVPGTRMLIGEITGLIFNPKFDDVGPFDNMHILNNLVGPWIDYHYGGGAAQVCKANVWAWLRRLQVYRHD